MVTLSMNAVASEDDGPTELPEVEPFYETFNGDLSAFEGSVNAFEIVTDDGGD